MAGLLYFLPERTELKKDELEGLGLGGVFAGRELATRHTEHGPTDGPGIVFRTQAPQGVHSPTLGCWPPGTDRPEADQRWTEGDPLWVGHHVPEPPTPDDLARAELVKGYRVRLADDQRWAVPLARKFPEGTALPLTLRFDKHLAPIWEPLPRHADFTQHVDGFWQALAEHDESTEDLDPDQWFDLAVEALAVNYRLGRREVGHLALLSTQNIWLVLLVMVDAPARAAAAEEQRD